MTKAISIALLLMSALGVALPAARADAPAAGAALRQIQANADAARDNAAIYQWKRVNLEVDRIAAAEKTVQTALADDTARQADRDALRQAVLALRSARQAHDPTRVADSARQVSEECRRLLS